MKKNTLLRYIIYFFSIILLVSIDQFTKFVAQDKLKYSNKHIVLKNILSFEYLENSGAAWGILSGKIIFFTIITIVIVSGLIYISYRIEKYLSRNDYVTRFGVLQAIIILLISGAIGNFIDRLRLNYVIDFIKVEFISFPTFNVADCYVSVSAFLLLIMLLFKISENDINKIFGK